MGQPAATGASQVMAIDIHIVMIPSPGGPIPTPLPTPFQGTLTSGLVASVKIAGQPAAVVGSGADNTPPHIPAVGPFQAPPSNKATVFQGSATVMIGGQPAARNLDPVVTCDDLTPGAAKGQVIAAGTVMIG